MSFSIKVTETKPEDYSNQLEVAAVYVNVNDKKEHLDYKWASKEELEVLPLMFGEREALEFYSHRMLNVEIGLP